MKTLVTYIMGAVFGASIYFLVAHQIINLSFVHRAYSRASSQFTKSDNRDKPAVMGTKTTASPENNQSILNKNSNTTSSFVKENMTKMNIKEKVGQMFMWQISEKTLSKETKQMLVETYAGGVIIMGEKTKSEISRLTKEIRSLGTPVPLFIAIDQEGGIVKRLIDDVNPGAQFLGDVSDDEFCTYIQNTSSMLSDAGVNINFGTVADIGWYDDSYIQNRTYGNTIEKVSSKVEMYKKCAPQVLSTVKHFPGHGRTKLDTHVTVPKINLSYEEWKKTDAVPFQKSIDAGIDIVMMGHLVYTDIASEPASLSPLHIKEVRKMGFTGVITTDDMGMLEGSGQDAFASLDQAIESGIDMMLYVKTKEKPQHLYDHALQSVLGNRNIENRIDESVKRILTEKEKIIEN